MKSLQREITGTQTRFSTKFGGKLSFTGLPHLDLLLHIFSLLLLIQVCTIISLKRCAWNADLVSAFHSEI
jgi:hypothetical protein